MRLCVLLLLMTIVAPAFAANRATVEQLEQVLVTAITGPDEAAAKLLSNTELTQRLSTDRLTYWEEKLPGPKSRQSLLALADSSAFLHPPASELPADAAPDLVAQRQIMSLVVNYVSHTLQALPNFITTRSTAYFEDRPQEDVQEETGMAVYSYQPLQVVDKGSTQVTYRDGQEVVSTEKAADGKHKMANSGMIARGTFGPILSVVLADAARNKLVWSHWERGVNGPRAVLSYSVPQKNSNYDVLFCCVQDGTNANSHPFHERTGYHGEIAVDPKSGAILRLTLQADLERGEPVRVADMMVEYGPVEIGGQSFICLVKSISLARAMIARARQGLYSFSYAKPVLKTFLNDVTFTQYHQFRSSTRIVSEANESPGEKSIPPNQSEPSKESMVNPASKDAPSTAPISDKLKRLMVIAGKVQKSGKT